MSLIEQALTRAKTLTGAPAETRKPVRRVIHRAALTVADSTPPRKFTTLSLNVAVMEKYGVLHDLSDDLALRAYKVLRTRVLRQMEAQNWRSLMVTSSAPGDGKTLTAINLAMTLAQDPMTSVFLVDLDLQRPSVARYLGLDFVHGISQYLAGEATTDQIIYDVGIDRLSVVPNAQPLQQSSELLSAPRMLELVQALNSEKPRRIVIYDMPPVLVGDDVMAFSDHADCVLLVASEGKTARSALESARDLVAEMNLVGVVLNRSQQGSDSAYSYY